MILTFQTKGHTDIIDITDKVAEVIVKEKIKEGIVNIFVKGSTAAVTTIEVDENLYDDLREVLDEIIPMDKNGNTTELGEMTMEDLIYAPQSLVRL